MIQAHLSQGRSRKNVGIFCLSIMLTSICSTFIKETKEVNFELNRTFLTH